MPLGGRLEKNQSDEKAAQGGSRGVERALRKRATPVVSLSQIAQNERLNNGTANTLSTRNKNYERDDRGNDKLRNEFLPKNILFSSGHIPRIRDEIIDEIFAFRQYFKPGS